MNRKQPKNIGFSMFELIVTMSISCLLLYSSFVCFDKSIQQSNAKSAAEQVVSAINSAKYYARAKGVTTALNFPVGSNVFSITADGAAITNSSNFDSTSGTLPKNIKILTNTCNDLNFFVDGSPVTSNGTSITQNCVITVGYSGGPQKNITIMGNSGNVTHN